MTSRDELQAQVDELMRKYDNEEISGAEYAEAMAALMSRAQE